MSLLRGGDHCTAEKHWHSPGPWHKTRTINTSVCIFSVIWLNVIFGLYWGEAFLCFYDSMHPSRLEFFLIGLSPSLVHNWWEIKSWQWSVISRHSTLLTPTIRWSPIRKHRAGIKNSPNGKRLQQDQALERADMSWPVEEGRGRERRPRGVKDKIREQTKMSDTQRRVKRRAVRSPSSPKYNLFLRCKYTKENKLIISRKQLSRIINCFYHFNALQI